MRILLTIITRSIPLTYLRGEKRICTFYINLAAVASDIVFLPPSERRKAIGERWGGSGTGACRGVLCSALCAFAALSGGAMRCCYCTRARV